MQKHKQIQPTITTFLKHPKIDKKQLEVKSDLSKSQDEASNEVQDNNPVDKKTQQKAPTMLNVEFYLNKRPSQPSGDYILNIHKNWCQDFNLLQRHHGFIQWLFPNSFTSRFNHRAQALSAEEQKIFRTNMTVAERYVFSYQMMLQFYGMKLKSKRTGEITQIRQFNYKQRYRATLLTSFHNHMRITRILCSLTMIGFGRYAKQLSLFLNNEIHSQKGQLRALAKYNVDKDWKEYQQFVETHDDLNVYFQQYETKEEHEKELNNKMAKSIQKIEENIIEDPVNRKKKQK